MTAIGKPRGAAKNVTPWPRHISAARQYATNRLFAVPQRLATTKMLLMRMTRYDAWDAFIWMHTMGMREQKFRECVERIHIYSRSIYDLDDDYIAFYLAFSFRSILSSARYIKRRAYILPCALSLFYDASCHLYSRIRYEILKHLSLSMLSASLIVGSTSHMACHAFLALLTQGNISIAAGDLDIRPFTGQHVRPFKAYHISPASHFLITSQQCAKGRKIMPRRLLPASLSPRYADWWDVDWDIIIDVIGDMGQVISLWIYAFGRHYTYWWCRWAIDGADRAFTLYASAVATHTANTHGHDVRPSDY